MTMPRHPWIAFTRAVSPAIAACELTHLERVAIHVPTAQRQHFAYEALLRSIGCDVRRVTPAPDCPDSVFIEDTAVVFDEVAVIARPGAVSRRIETPDVEVALAGLRPVVRIEAPATVDGGDVLTVRRTVFVGRSGRTNDEGIRQLRALLAPHGYDVIGLDVTGCLHLKSAVTAVDVATVLLNPAWVSPSAFARYRIVEVDPREPMGANVLRVGGELIHDAAYPRTRARLESLGHPVHTVDLSELAKAEGAVTCGSLIVRA